MSFSSLRSVVTSEYPIQSLCDNCGAIRKLDLVTITIALLRPSF